MDTVDLLPTQKDKDLRKHWLLFAIVFTYIWPIIQTLFSFWQEVKNIPSIEALSYQEIALYLVGFLFVIATIGLIPFYLIYYCAYKKPGTKLLALNAYLMPFAVIVNLVNLLKNPLYPLDLGLCFINSAVDIYWAYLCFKLRKINKKLKLQNDPKMLSVSEYLQQLKELENVNDLESLDETFSALIRAWPQFEPVTTEKYKLRKATLA